MPGVHKLKVPVLGMMMELQQEFIFDEQIIFDAGDMMENFEYTAELYDPLGDKILIRKGGVDYDCFRFRAVIGVTHSNVVLTSS
jgi:hypothetical protein